MRQAGAPSTREKTPLHQLVEGSRVTLLLVAVLGTSTRTHAELIPRVGNRRLRPARRPLIVDISTRRHTLSAPSPPDAELIPSIKMHAGQPTTELR